MNWTALISRNAAWAFALASAVGFTAPMPVRAADPWPIKPIRMLVPYAPGAGAERVVRPILEGVSKRLGQPVVIEYKPGAGGNLAFAELVRSNGDGGYTWLLGADTTWTLNPHVYRNRNAGFTQADVVPVNLISSVSFVLVCNPQTGVKTPQELVARAKAKPTSFSSSGAGSPEHATMAMMMEMGKFEMTHVPYRGPGQAVTDLIGGQVDCGFVGFGTVQEHIRSGRLTGVAASTRQRIAGMANLATMHEQGFKDFDATSYVVLFAPNGVTKDAMEKFHKAMDETIRSPEIQQAFAANSNRPEGMTPDASLKTMQQLSAQWQSVVKRMNITVD